MCTMIFGHEFFSKTAFNHNKQVKTNKQTNIKGHIFFHQEEGLKGSRRISETKMKQNYPSHTDQ